METIVLWKIYKFEIILIKEDEEIIKFVQIMELFGRFEITLRI